MNTEHGVRDYYPLKEPVQERSRETRKKILKAARALFTELGFEETTTHLIAERAGLSVGGIYAHFKNKEDIFLYILELRSKDVYETTVECMKAIRRDRMNMEDALEYMFSTWYNAHLKNGKLNLEMHRFCMMNEIAGKIHDYWEKAEADELLAIMRDYSDSLKVDDLETAVTVMTRATHEVFQYIYKVKEQSDKEAVLSSLITMVKKYLLS